MTEEKKVPAENKSKQMTLSQCGQFDKQNNAKNRLTGWSIICRDRYARGVSRRARINRKKGLTK